MKHKFKIEYFIKQGKSGNILIVTNEGDYIIACSADYGYHYGIAKKGDEFFMPINKGAGKSLYNEIIKQIETNKLQVLIEHIFVTSEEDKDFCKQCGKNFRNPVHCRNQQVNPVFQNIINQL